jgi:transcriptional regulator with XRE-family HTH domain
MARPAYRTREPGASPLADRRLVLGLTQLAVADRAGLTVQTIKRLERGDPSVTRASALAVAFVLGFQHEWVALGSGC